MWLLSILWSFEHNAVDVFFAQMVVQAWLMSIITSINHIFIKNIYEIWNVNILGLCKYIIAKSIVKKLVQTNMININHDWCQ